MDGTVAETPEKVDKEEVAVKMSGYLEKRGKFRLVATWKRYWFVLEGRLLLYYTSEEDYVNLSACRGSINMGLVTCVRPGSGRSSKQNEGFTIEVVTRTQLIVLRMKERLVQEQWLQSLLDSTGGSLQAQTVAGNGIGTLHFRYSMDALPTPNKEEPSVEEKQSTLPRPKHDSSKTRQQSIIKHIKKIGGKTYVGSLDAALKVRNNAYGSGNQEANPVCNLLNGHVQHESPNEKGSGELKILSVNSTTNNFSAFPPEYAQPQTLGEKTHTQNSSLDLDTNLCDQQGDVSVNNSADFINEEREKASNPISQVPHNNQIHAINERNYNGDYSSEKGILQINTDGKVIENGLYIQDSGSANELYNSINNLSTSSGQHNEPNVSGQTNNADIGTEEQYDVIKSVLPLKLDEKRNSFTSTEDIYYSCYDKTSLMEQLTNEQSGQAEPELPPRPHASPEPIENRLGSTSTVVEDDYAEYCTLDTVSPPLSPSTASITSSGEESGNKKEKNKFGARKKRNSESESADENSTKVTRKISFIHRLIGKYHKKKSKHQTGKAVASVQENNDGSEYAVIEYHTIQSDVKKEKESDLNRIKQLDSDDEETHDKSVASMCSAKSLLPNNTFQELQQRLKQRTSPYSIQDSEEELDYEAEYAECTDTKKEQDSSNTPSTSRKKPVPVPRKNIGKSTEELGESSDSGSARHTSNTPPKLPPRRMIRPHSPWHDVPSNNSPIYGNCEEVFGTRHRDSLLGTPEGYRMVKNKWHAAEMSICPRPKGTQWNRELQQVTFPSRLAQRVPQWEDEGSGDPACGYCSHDDKEQSNEHITAVVEKHIPTTVGVNLHEDDAALNRNCTGTAGSQPAHKSETFSDESDTKILSVSNDGNKITLVATVHCEDCCLQSCNQLNQEPGRDSENTHHETNTKITELIHSRGENNDVTAESATNNILRAVSDEQLSTDTLKECADILPKSPRQFDDTPFRVLTESESKAPNDEQRLSEACREPYLVEKKPYEFTAVSNITLTNLHSCSKKNTENLHDAHVCALTTLKISDDIDPDSLMSNNNSQCSENEYDKQELRQTCEVLVQEPACDNCKCVSVERCTNCVKNETKKPLPDSRSLAESDDTVHDNSLENFEEVELRKHPGAVPSRSVVHTTASSDGSTCPTCSFKAASARDNIFDGTKAIQCIRYDDDGCITDKQVVPVTKRYSDELNLLLAQLAEITSAPLLSPGVTISLVDFPEKRKHPGQMQDSEFDEWAAIGPIRRRRHSDPDYDVPRPHRSLLQLLLSGGEKEKTDKNDTIEATMFFSKTEPCVVPRPDPAESNGQEMVWPELLQSQSCSQNARRSKNSVQSQTDALSVSITPDSLEMEQT